MTQTNFTSVNYIITAKHYGGSARQYIRDQQIKLHRDRGIAVTIKDLDKEPSGAPVYARISRGQWIADCECNTAAFVDPDEPLMFCFGCGNRSNGSRPRPVVFPPREERLEIERLLLERPVNDVRGLTDMERAGNAEPMLWVQVEDPQAATETSTLLTSADPPVEQPKRVVTLPLPRSWEPGETIDDLHKQQDHAIDEWHKALRTGGGRVVQ